MSDSDELTAESVVEQLIPIYREINTLMDDAKAILAEAKEAELPAAMLAKIAKAKADSKLEDLEDKTKSLLELIESTS